MGTKNFSNANDLITFSRASAGTALRKVAYGPELISNGEFTSDTSGWIDVFSTLSAAGEVLTITADGSGYGRAQLLAPLTLTTGKTYVISFDIPETDGGNPKLVKIGNIANGNSHLSESFTAAGSYSFSFVATSSIGYVTLSLNNSVTSAQFDNVSIKEVLFDQGDLTLFNHPAGIPRIEYDADGNVLGLLVEEARTNLITYSEDIGGLNQATADEDVAIAPDMSQTADKLIESTSNSVHWTYNSISAIDNQDYTFSVYAKKSERTRLTIYPNNKANVGFNAVYDLDAGTVVSTPAQMTATIKDVGNGWYRCVGTWNANTGGSAVFVRVGLVSSGTNISYQGDGSSGLFLWGQQLEAGAFPTSYIPTNGATATRSADAASIPVADFGYNQSVGSVVVECENPYVGSGSIMALNEGIPGNSDNRIIVTMDGARTNTFFISSGGVGSVAISKSIISGTPLTRFGVSWEENDATFVRNADTPVTDTSATIPNSLTKMEIGSYSGLGAVLTTHIKSIKYFPRKLTDAQLQELTT